MEIIIYIILLMIPTDVSVDQNVNCEYLFFSGQGTEIENEICAGEYKRINQETLEWKRAALEARGIY